MTIFFNFFLKTFAFLAAVTIFVVFLGFLLTLFEETNLGNQKYVIKQGKSDALDKIVLVRLRGPILSEPTDILEYSLIGNITAIYVSGFLKNLKEIQIEKPKGIVISIDSPGGSVSATYKLYKTLEKFKKNNQTKIFFHTNELLASGGYWAGLAGDKIFASYGAMIGNIGVRGPDWIYFNKPILISNGIIGQTIQTKDGIEKYNTIAGRSKDMFDSFRMPTEEEIKSLQNIVDNIYIDFVNIVSKKRSIENNIIIDDLGALIFDAKTAKSKYLIDDIKNLDEVINEIAKELKLKDYKVIEKEKNKSFFENILQTSLIFKYDINKIKKNRICKLINGYANVMIIDNKYINKC